MTPSAKSSCQGFPKSAQYKYLRESGISKITRLRSMVSDIIIVDEPYIWVGSLKEGNSSIELSKLTNQQYFLIGNNPEAVVEFYQKISGPELREIDLATAAFPFTRLRGMDLLLISLN